MHAPRPLVLKATRRREGKKKRPERRHANQRQGKEDTEKDIEDGLSDTARSGICRVSNSAVMLEALCERNVRASDSAKLA